MKSTNKNDLTKRSRSFITHPQKQRKKLPENFFERILVLEMNIRNSFQMELLNEMIKLYTGAIEYYESLEDPRFADYQNRMEMLLSDPDILKAMNEHKKQQQQQQDNSNVNTNASILKTKSNLKIKLDYNKHLIDDNTQKEVTGLLKLKEDNENTTAKNVQSMINDELTKQNDKWKEKLKKKKHINKCRSNIGSPKREMKFENIAPSNQNKESNTNNNNNDIQSDIKPNNDLDKNVNNNEIIKTDKKIDINEPMHVQKEEHKKQVQNEENENEHKIETDEDFRNILKEKLNELDLALLVTSSLTENKEDNDSTPNNNAVMNSLLNLNEVPIKYHNVCNRIEERINSYISEFNSLFYKEIFQSFFTDLKKLIDEKYDKYIEITVNYHSQIKENEFLLDPNSNDPAQEEIKQAIELLKEDQEHQIGIVEFQYNSMINQKISDFKLTALQNNPSLILLEEQLKLDVYQIINDAL